MPRAENLRDVTNGVIFDTQHVATTATTKLTFFQQDRSQGIQLTNMRVRGAMPTPEAFIVRSMRIGPIITGNYQTGLVPFAQPSMSDALEVLHLGSVYFEVGSKPFVDYWPLQFFNLGQTYAATNYGPNTSVAAPNFLGAGSPGAVINLNHPIRLNPQEPFRGEITWTLAPTPTAQISIMWVLGGTWIRAVQ